VRDISDILDGWPFDSSKVQSRIAEAPDGRRVIQLRIDMGVLQMEIDGRPDGERPGGHESILEQYRALARRVRRRAKEGGSPDGFEIPPEDYAEVDREILQYYHRRLAFYGTGDYARAARDAEHSLALLELVRKHAKNPKYVGRISAMVPSVLMELARTRALVSLKREDAKAAVGEIEKGIERIQEHLRGSSSEAGEGTAREIAFLRRWARRIRRAHALGEPPGGAPIESAERRLVNLMRRRLSEAIEREDYREAARLRDEIRRRSPRR
jgi:hypothetical protein